jgi:uncharacterized protein (TIGR02996 family)
VTDGDALLLEILANPADDLVRLVYADWLEEVGEAERASLIRVQIELFHSLIDELLAQEQRLLGPVGERVWQRRREWALPPALLHQWPTDVGGWEWHRGFPEVWHCPLALWEAHGPALVATNPVRRVVVIDREPQRSVINPRKPERTWYRDEGNWVQPPEAASLLLPPLFDLLEPDVLDFAMLEHSRTYSSRAAAVSALSEACLRQAQRQPARV